MVFNLQEVVRPNIWALKPYRCARDDYSTGILLDANENTHGPALRHPSDYPFKNLERYPDPHQKDIKELLCKLRKIPSTDYFFLGVGSDECIDMTIRVFVQPGLEKILVCPPTYGIYSVCAQINDIGVVQVPLQVENCFQLDVQNILETLKNDPLIKIVFLCSPGNPTGTLLRGEDILTILESEYKGIVVVDEAYIDFCGEGTSAAKYVTEYPNLIVSQTLSKAFGLAAIRLGFTISSPEIASIFNKTKAPYNISTPTSSLANAALTDGIAVMQSYVASIQIQRALLLKEIAQISYVKNILGANDANFILVQIMNNEKKACNETAMRIYKHLAEVEGVVIRFRGNEIGCLGGLRISVGTEEENKILCSKMRLIT